MSEERWAFVGQWLDGKAALQRQYTLVVYPASHEVEMIDNKLRRIFLRRTRLEGIQPSMFFVGASVNILGRQIDLIDYGDEYTRQTLGNKQERTCIFVVQEALPRLGQILDSHAKAVLSLVRAQLITLDGGAARALQQQGLDTIHPGQVVAIESVGTESVSKARDIARDFSGASAAPDATAATAILNALADARLPLNCRLKGTTVCLIKPHAVAAGQTGQIIDDIIKAGFTITGLRTQTLSRNNASEFLEVYKGVVPEYNAMVAELEAGLSVALELWKDGPLQADFRALCGPADSEVARHLRPSTLRAKYGFDKVQNAVHCTDLAEDQALEVEYFFSILATSA